MKLTFCPQCGSGLTPSRTFFAFYGGGQCLACDDCEIAWSIGVDEDETEKMYGKEEQEQ